SKISNNGIISLSINATEAKSVRGAGIWVSNSEGVILSNAGSVLLRTNAANANLRTLRVENSKVTIANKFSVVFGLEGIKSRPIHVVGSNSILNLNNATLVARKGPSLELNKPYYLIEVNNGTVLGQWGGLMKGYANTDIVVDWYGQDRGAGSAVIFSYQPQGSAAGFSLLGGDITSSGLVNQYESEVSQDELGNSLMGGGGIGVYSSLVGSRVAFLGVGGERKGGMYVLPFSREIESRGRGFVGKAEGLVFGFDIKPTSRYRIGLYGANVGSDIRGEASGIMGVNQRMYGVGIYGSYISKPIYVGFNSFVHVGEHVLAGRTGMDYEFEERGEYRTRGLNSRISLGYVMSGEGWYVVPGLGVGYKYIGHDSFSTRVSDSNWVRKVRGGYVSYPFGLLGVSFGRGWTQGGARVTLTGSIAVEQALGRNDIITRFSIPGINTGEVEVRRAVRDTSIDGRVYFNIAF
ncbi:MAG: autotransporter outer membrane beta-barrel domain-containing protein, partial [Caldimicrobium sp.]